MTFPFPHPAPMPRTLPNIIRSLGLASGLKLALDATDYASYPGSGQTWFDQSGNGYDFFRGGTNTASTDDPTFNGTPGVHGGAYWSFDGGDFFRYKSANEAWMNNLHKANAKGTLCAWVYPLTGVNDMICGTVGASAATPGNIGFWFGNGTDNFASYRVGNGSVQIAAYQSASLTISNAQWQFLAVSFDAAIGANGAFIQINGTQVLVNSSFSASASASNASNTMEVAARGNGAAKSPMPNGSRMAQLAAWEGVALTQAQVTSIFEATRGFFGV